MGGRIHGCVLDCYNGRSEKYFLFKNILKLFFKIIFNISILRCENINKKI